MSYKAYRTVKKQLFRAEQIYIKIVTNFFTKWSGLSLLVSVSQYQFCLSQFISHIDHLLSEVTLLKFVNWTGWLAVYKTLSLYD